MFGPHALWRFPELLYRLVTRRGRIFDIADEPGSIAEGIPLVRQEGVKAWVSVMYGCNNFCTYCIVPYVRGRERSREPAVVLDEIRGLAAEGYKDITLLGQNVNSYGRDLEEDVDFADLLKAASEIEGDFLLRFMTSHPKDASQKLFDVMASSPKIAPCFHLPFQSGSDRILKAMNRVYDRAGYLDKVRRLRQAVPGVVITSDVIVGFPGETEADFEDTMSLIDEVRFDALFTFIFSPREGTPAARLPDDTPKEVKAARFQRLVERQDQISEEKHAAYIGKTVRCLVDGKDEKGLTARTPGNRLVRLTGDEGLIGRFADVRITGANKWSLSGEAGEVTDCRRAARKGAPAEGVWHEQVSHAKEPQAGRLGLYCRRYLFHHLLHPDHCPVLSSVGRGGLYGRPPPELTELGICVDQAIREIVRRTGVRMEHQVIMPNHVHLLVLLERAAIKAAPYGKTAALQRGEDRGSDQIPCGLPGPRQRLACRQPLAARGIMDHIIRGEEDFLRIWTYLDNNPQKWELDRYYTQT